MHAGEATRARSPGAGLEVLEELLTCDDLFLEYFNAFLALPAFPLRMRYDPLRGQLQELDGFLLGSPSEPGTKPSSAHYGATDAERERTLAWLRRERLPYFQRTALYLEYKLAKLLVRPLDEGYPVSLHEIRGYSRQSDSTAASSIPSNPSTAELPTGLPSLRLWRPPSQTHTSPAHLEGSMDSWVNAATSGRSLAALARGTASSAPTTEHMEYHLGRCQGQPGSGGRKMQFNLHEPSASEKGGGEGPCLLPGFGRPALQQLKEEVLGTRAGMDDFKAFLQDTLGTHLLHFWMECEAVLEHTKASAAQQEAQLLRASLCRHVQDKYKLSLSLASQEPACEEQGSMEATFTAFSRSQYDALRRLRAYWVPRFLLHHQRSRPLRAVSTSGSRPQPRLLANADFLRVHKLPHLGTSWRGRMVSARRPDLPWNPPDTPLTSHLLQALRWDLGAGGNFLHYLTRLEDAQKVHNFHLWQALEEHWEAGQWQADGLQLHSSAWQILHTYLVHGALCDVGLSSEMPHYILHLQAMLSSSSQPLEPLALQPVAQHVLAVLCEAWLRYLRCEIVTFLEARKGKGNTLFPAQGGREQQRQRQRAAVKPLGSGSAGLASREGSVTPKGTLDLLSNQVVFKAYRKAAQEMQDAGLQRVLRLLQKLESCQAAPEGRKRLSCVQKLLDLWDQQEAGALSSCLPWELRKRLRAEVGRGRVSASSLEELQAALHAHIAPAFESFWAEVSKGLDRHGVQPSRIQEEGWLKLKPLLQLLAAKVALKHLRNGKGVRGSAATAQASQEDKASFCQFLRAAAEGWPTLEMLHFLKHLQTHGPAVLEHGLHFQLEVQKFKNAHHNRPDRALLRKKVQVIHNCFLVSQLEPRLQVMVEAEKLGRAIWAAEQALQQDTPAPPSGLFDELRDSVFSTLLPYWAAFQKAWLKQSLASAQRAPVLRVQQLLQLRQALFEQPRDLPPTYQLPPLQQRPHVKGSKQRGSATYTFSLSRGLALKVHAQASSNDDTGRTSVFGSGKRATRVQLSPLPEVPVLL